MKIVMDEFVKVIMEFVANNRISEDVAYLLIKKFQHSKQIVETNDNKKEIAIIGMACRFPQSRTKDEFWSHLRDGNDLVSLFPKSRYELVLPFSNGINREKVIPAGYLEDIDKFDADFFQILPGEAVCMDPQQRLFMEVGYEALEDAGYAGKKVRNSSLGIFVGYSEPRYEELVDENRTASFVGNFPPIIASRLSYFLNLSGPAISVATACSSSLVALDMACNSLLANECKMALVGGVAIKPMPGMEELGGIGISSPNGVSRSFDIDADGTGWGEGCGAVIIKSLEEAKKDKDNIYAVIKGRAINQDGKSNGIASPNALAQKNVLTQAWKNAGIPPQRITYIEAHGTGAQIGDPIEVKGLTDAFQKFTKRKQFCAIGSVKSNMGHLDSAAGIAGLIKVILALQHKELPASLHFRRANALMNLENSPVYVNTKLRKWKQEDGKLRYAGISSFGFSGTNCHIVLEEYPDEPHRIQNSTKEWVFTISARDNLSFYALLQKYISFLEENEKYTLEEICYVLNTGREHQKVRCAIPCRKKEKLLSQLKSLSLHLEEKETCSLKGIYLSSDVKIQKSHNKLVTGYKEETIQAAKKYVRFEKVDWKLFYPVTCRKVSLPTYAWNRKSYWVDKEDENISLKEDSIEHSLQAIWEKLLGIQDIKEEQNFFDLGGDSLLANDLIALIYEKFQVSILFQEIFLNATLKKMCQLIKSKHANVICSKELKKAFGQLYYPVSSGQKRQYILNQISPGSVCYNMPCICEVTGDIAVERIEGILQKIVNRHEVFRTKFHIIDNEIKQQVEDSSTFKVTYGMVDKEDIPKLIKQFIRPFDLSKAPLLRVGYYEINEEGKHLLMMDMHHIISDGKSMEILIRELGDLYLNKELPELAIQYKDFACWQYDFLKGEEIKKQEAFWIHQLQTEKVHTNVLNLPYDYPRPKIMSFEGENLDFFLEQRYVRQLKKLANSKGTTVYIVLLTIYTMLLHLYTDQKEFIVGSLISSRHFAKADKTIGLFTNYLPLKMNINRDLVFEELLEQVKETTIQAFDNQDYPFEMIVEKLNVNKDLSRNPLFDTMIILHNQGKQKVEIDLGPIQLKMLDYNKGSTTLDLKTDVYMREDGTFHFSIEYYKRIFKKETIALFARHFKKAIIQVLSETNLKIHQYILFTEEESMWLSRKRKFAENGFRLPELQAGKKRRSYVVTDGMNDLKAGRSCVGNYVFYLRWSGEVNVREVLEQMVRINQNLRTTFEVTKENQVFRIRNEPELPLIIEERKDDLNETEFVKKKMIEAGKQNYIKDQELLWKAEFFYKKDGSSYLIFSFHKILLNLYSPKQFINDLFCIARDMNTQSNPKLRKKEQISGLDYIEWMKEAAELGYLETEKYFWEQKKELQTDFYYNREQKKQTIGNDRFQYCYVMSEEDSQKLFLFTEKLNCKAAHLFLAAYALVVRQLTKNPQVSIEMDGYFGRNINKTKIPYVIGTPITVCLDTNSVVQFEKLIVYVKECCQQTLENANYLFMKAVTDSDKSGIDVPISPFLFSDDTSYDYVPDDLIEEMIGRYSTEYLLQLSIMKAKGAYKIHLIWNSASDDNSFASMISDKYKLVLNEIINNIEL